MSFNYDRYDRRQPATRTRSTLGYGPALRAVLTLAANVVTATGCP